MNNYRRKLKERSGAESGSQPPRNSGGRRARAGGGGAAAAATSSRSKVGKGSPQKVGEKNVHKKSISSIPCSSGSASLRGNDKFTTTNPKIGTDHHNICSATPQEAGGSTSTNHTNMKTAATAAEKSAKGGGGGAGDFVNECPRVIIPLTGKEKEEDFLAMKGTKLPHRPKKRLKTVDRMLQYCFPGMWLSDVTRARYEVKEKKCTTKKPKRRGLKGMESMDSYSE